MDFGMPSYKRDGEVEIAFASQKKYISLYILREDVLDAHRDRLGGISACPAPRVWARAAFDTHRRKRSITVSCNPYWSAPPPPADRSASSSDACR
jgi:hypothetical protein